MLPPLFRQIIEVVVVSNNADPDQARRGRLLAGLLPLIMLTAVPMVPFSLLLGFPYRAEVIAGTIGALLIAYFVARQGRVHTAVYIMIADVIITATCFDLGPSGEIQGLLDPFYLVGAIGIAGVFLPNRQVLAVMVICFADALFLYGVGIPVLAPLRATHPDTLLYTISVDFTVYMVNGLLFVLASGLIGTALQEERARKEELGEIAHNQSRASRQVQEVLGALAASLSLISTRQTEAVTAQSQALLDATSAGTELYTSVERIAEQAQTLFAPLAALESQLGQRQQLEVQAHTAVAATIEQQVMLINLINEYRQIVKQAQEALGQIGEIAIETRMLAFNANIEAAGAGDAGRRFAVIAGNFQQLALQVESTAESVRVMLAKLDRTDQDLDPVMSSSRELALVTEAALVRNQSIQDAATAAAASVAQLTTQLAASTQQQRTAAAQIQQTMTDLHAQNDLVVEEAAHLVEAASEMRQAVVTLSDAVEGTSVPPLSPWPPAPAPRRWDTADSIITAH